LPVAGRKITIVLDVLPTIFMACIFNSGKTTTKSLLFGNLTPVFEGWKGIVHGGIQATLIDEVASWYIFAVLGTSGVTSDLNIRYKKPLPVNARKILVRAHSPISKKRLLTLACSIQDEAGVEYATGEVTYFIFPETVAREKYRYPGKEAFLD